MRGLFVTGTDTDVGKTRVAVALLRALATAGVRAVGMKPVAAGFEPGGTVNGDVVALAAADGLDVPLAERNPYAFGDAVAPHLAAENAGVAIALPVIEAAARRLASRADAVIVEGAGGALVPLDAASDVLDIAARLDLPVLLVVGMRLGCLNHAALSALAIRRRGLVLAGWVANALPPRMPLLERNVRTLAARLGAPPLAAADVGEALQFDADTLADLGLAARVARGPW